MPKMLFEYKKAAIAKIVQTAFEILDTKGHQDLTMDEIAKRLGISKGALYSYFTSKEEILKEIYKSGRQIVQRILLEASECNDFKQTMELIFKLMSDKYEKQVRIYFEILALALHNEGIRKTLKEDYEKDFDMMHSFVQHLVAKKQIRTDVNSRTLAHVFRSLWMGACEKLILGYDTSEIHENWITQTSLMMQEIDSP